MKCTVRLESREKFPILFRHDMAVISLSRRPAVYFARAEINEKTEAKYTVWSDKTGFRVSQEYN